MTLCTNINLHFFQGEHHDSSNALDKYGTLYLRAYSVLSLENIIFNNSSMQKSVLFLISWKMLHKRLNENAKQYI